nr:hypothetical protein [Tolivirales sp.]
MHRDNPFPVTDVAVSTDLNRGSGGLSPPPAWVKHPPPPSPTIMATTLDFSRPIQPSHPPTISWWKRLCRTYVVWANTTATCVPCGRVKDEWLDYEIDQEMRRQVMEEICQPADEYGDDVGLIIEDVRGSGGFGSVVHETSCATVDEVEPPVIPAAEGIEGCSVLTIGEVECPVSIVVGDVVCPIADSTAALVEPEEDVGEEPPDLGTGQSTRRRLRVHAKFVARMVMVLRARHGRLPCEPANQLLVSNDYSRILRRPEYNMRSADIEAHRRDVINVYFADLPFERAPLVRSRLPVWFKDLMGVPELAERPLVC